MKNSILWIAFLYTTFTNVYANVPQNTEALTKTINCTYKIPLDVKEIDPALLIVWSEKAVVQSFDFFHAALEKEIRQLQPCFTTDGWVGFNKALQQSGNIEAIKTQKLTVSSHVEGRSEIIETHNNQWKINIPLRVVYQNEKEKVTQLLQVNVVIIKKSTGDLGIIQFIATPRSNTKV